MIKRRYLLAAGLWSGVAGHLFAERSEHIEFDASQATIAEQSAPYIEHWQGTNPKGVRLSADKSVLLKDGKPFPVAAGEFHPQRYPAEFWEEAIIEMKAGGLNVVSSYWFWSLTEPLKGKFDFTGQNDVRRYVALCHKHGMLVFIRPGPYCNSEFLNGGLPPWVFGLPARERSNDPVYLERVKLYYEKLGEQLEGMMWDEGGPIYMAQVENELGIAPIQWGTSFRHGAGEEHPGPADPEEYWKHYLNLKQMAIEAGIKVPFYTLTAWGPEKQRSFLKMDGNFIFSFGGYMYLGRPTPGSNSLLTTLQPDERILKFQDPYPLSFIELGAAGTPHRVGYAVVPPPESAESTAMSRLGTHKSLSCGWYTFHGGTNPHLPGWGPTAKQDGFGLSYDFNAPLSEYGYERPAYYLLRRFHQTLLNFGDRFCYGEIIYQDPPVKPDDDQSRASVRMGSKDGGMLFISHYGNQVPLSPCDISYELKTASGAVRIPAEGKMSLKNGDFALLPFNWDLGRGVKLISSTAMPSGKIEDQGTLAMICSSLGDQSATFAFELPDKATLTTNGSHRKTGNQTIVSIKPAMDALIRIKADGGEIICAVLPREKILHSVENAFNGRKTYLISNQDLAITKAEDNATDVVRLTGKGENNFELYSYPPVKWLGVEATETVGLFAKANVSVPQRELAATIEAFNDKKWLIKIPATSFEGLNDIFAHVAFQGLICRIFNQNTGRLEGDQLWAEDLDWNVGLKRFRDCLADEGLLFYANPADAKTKKQISSDGMTLEESRSSEQESKIEAIRLVPEYKLILEMETPST